MQPVALTNLLSPVLFLRKYPSISSDEERDRYKAVFNDQYAEYKELHVEVQAMAKKFEEMDEMMQNLPSRPSSQMVQLSLSSTQHVYKHIHTHTNTWMQNAYFCPITVFWGFFSGDGTDQ